jgi:CBS domain-containing protein
VISTGRGFNVNVQSILGVKGTNVVTVRDDISLADAASILRDQRVGALVVSNDGQHIDGIISERDVVRALANHGASVLGRPVSSAMSTDVVTCRAGDAVESLMVSMTERRIRHLPVVDDDAMLGGVISIGDVVKARLGQLETENQQLYEYITQGR